MNIKYYSKNKSIELLDRLYKVTEVLEKDYPIHKEWFYNKFVSELDGVKREIIYYEKNNIIYGVVFLKKHDDEKKICTIYVDEKYRKQGVGTKLIKESMKFLDTQTPFITMPDYKEKCFLKIIEKYNWKKTQEIDSYYSSNKELVFNGFLTV